jgi:hypothetical protein
MANEFTARNGLIAQNNSVITGSLIVTSGITGSLLGTASTASYVTGSIFTNGNRALSASYAISASFAPDTTFPYTGSATISGSLVITGSLTGSLVVNGLIIGKGKNTLDNVYINTNGSSITTGVQNYCIGTSAGTGITSGIYNVCIGHTAGVSINSGASNITIGRQAGGRITTGTGNLAIGETSMYYNNTGNYNSAYGTLAMLGTDGTANSNNTAIGAVCAYTIAAGSNNNVFVGYQAARYISGGVTAIALVSASVFIGMNSMPLSQSQTNQIVIGYSATGLGSNTAVIGNDSIITTALKGNILIGTTTDAGYKLNVVGTSRLNGNSYITGSLNVTAGITGSLLGTASYATQALSASFAPSTPTFPFTGSAIITGSLSVTGTTIAGFNPAPRTGSIRDGVTSVLGDLQDWNSNYYSGEVLYSEVSGEAINYGQLCYRDRFGKWSKALGNTIGDPAKSMLGICLYTVGAADTATSILTRGYVETTYTDGGSGGAPLFMDASTAGSITVNSPSAAGNVVRIIGNVFWNSAFQSNSVTIVYFNPDNTWIEL